MKNLLFLALLTLFICSNTMAQVERVISIPSSQISDIKTSRTIDLTIDDTELNYELERFEVPQFPILVDGMPYEYPKVDYYKARGKNALISVYNDQTLFVSEFEGDNVKRVQPYGNRYKTFEGPIGSFDEAWCDVKVAPRNAETPPIQEAPGDVGTCILVDYIITQSVYNTFGNIDSAVQYITELAAISTLLYANEGVDKRPSFMKFFTTENEWFTNTVNSSYDGLYALQDYVRVFGISGNSAHLIHLQPGIGGVAYLGGWNPNANVIYRTAFSAIRDNYNDISQYSWTTMVWSHEEGHNAGSYHTHNCDNWGIDTAGNPVAYDKASAYNEGTCELIDRCPNGHATIMSYGHLSGGSCPVQMYFADGPVTNVNGYYERLPGDVIRTARDTWGFVCVEACDGPGALTTTEVTATTATVNWTGDPNAEYIVQLNDDTPVSTTGNSINVSGLLPNSYNCVNIEQVCNDTINSITATTCFETPCDLFIEGDHVDDMSEDLWSKQGWIHNPEGFYELPEDSSFYSNGGFAGMIDYELNRTMSLGSYCFRSTGDFAIIKTMIGGGSEPNWDAMKLEINNGGQWEQIGTYPEFYNDDDTYQYDPGWSGIFPTDMLQWDISPYVEPGTEFRFRFTFFSDVLQAQNGGPEIRHFEVQYGSIGTCDSTVYDTSYVEVEVFDTTYVTEYDTVTVNVFDTTFVEVEVFDTTLIEVFDTTFVTETIYDTITVIETEIVYDTTYVTETVYDTVVVEIEVCLDYECADTIYITQTDTVYIDTCDDTSCEISIVAPCYVYYEIINSSGQGGIDYFNPTVVNGSPPYMYSYSTPIDQVTPSTGLTITVVDANGCIASVEANIQYVNNNCAGNPRQRNKVIVCRNGVTECLPIGQVDFNNDVLGECNVNPCLFTTAQPRVQFIESSNVKLFPNPTTGIINVIGLSNELFYVMDGSGRRLIEGQMNENKIDASLLEPGIYDVVFPMHGIAKLIVIQK